MRNIKGVVHTKVQQEIKNEIRSIQTHFDRFEKWISHKMEDAQSQNLKGIHDKLDSLCDVVEDMYSRPFPLISIIEEIIKEEVPNI